MYFTEGPYTNLPPEAIGPKGSKLLLKGVFTSISKETYNHLWFSRWGLDPCSHLDLPKILLKYRSISH